jgi:hypothetical protein
MVIASIGCVPVDQFHVNWGLSAWGDGACVEKRGKKRGQKGGEKRGEGVFVAWRGARSWGCSGEAGLALRRWGVDWCCGGKGHGGRMEEDGVLMGGFWERRSSCWEGALCGEKGSGTGEAGEYWGLWGEAGRGGERLGEAGRGGGVGEKPDASGRLVGCSRGAPRMRHTGRVIGRDRWGG